MCQELHKKGTYAKSCAEVCFPFPFKQSTFKSCKIIVIRIFRHTGDTPFKCDICKKSFTRKEHYVNHYMWHTGETPHQCTVCGKKYTRKEHLANHQRSHTNENPFRCEICGKCFSRKEHFTNHILWSEIEIFFLIDSIKISNSLGILVKHRIDVIFVQRHLLAKNIF